MTSTASGWKTNDGPTGGEAFDARAPQMSSSFVLHHGEDIPSIEVYEQFILH
jgi:hypothetical protein